MASFNPASGVWSEDYYDEFGNVVRYVYYLVCRYTISTKLLRILLPVLRPCLEISWPATRETQQVLEVEMARRYYATDA